MIQGIDFLGLAHRKINVRRIARMIPPNVAIGVFDDPFGPVLRKLRKLMDTKKVVAVRIHAHWDTRHRIVPLAKLRQKCPSYEKLAKDYPHIPVYVSHSCEYEENSLEEVQKRIDIIREKAPSCIPVNAVMRGATVKGVITEHHGDVGVRVGDIVSHDGINCYDIDMERWKQKNDKALFQFFWGLRFNLREIPDEGQQVPPPIKRTATPDGKYIRSILRLMAEVGEPPKFTVPLRPFRKPLIWKTHAEDMQGVASTRENKPVVILPVKASRVEVVASNNKVVATLRYGGTFGSRMSRYYSHGLWGWQMAKRALKISGSEWCYLQAGRRKYGPINPAFRAGVFR